MGNNPGKTLSVVIPVYGSEEILPELISQLESVLDHSDLEYEVILVCDQSPDRSWQVIQNLVRTRNRFHGILLRMNVGQHNALMAGLRASNGEIIITMDDDLQHSPKDISLLVKGISEGYDVSYARFQSRYHPFWKLIGSRVNDIVARFLMGKPAHIYLSPFRAFSASIRDEVLKYRGPYVYLDGLILSVTRNIVMVDVKHHDRFAGVSRYGFKKSFALWLKMATSFSILPLRITSFLGLIFSGLGFLLAILLIIQKFTLNAMPIGWSSLIVTVLILGGVQLLAVGMLGEYLGRVLLTLDSRPQFVIGEDTTSVPNSDSNNA